MVLTYPKTRVYSSSNALHFLLLIQATQFEFVLAYEHNQSCLFRWKESDRDSLCEYDLQRPSMVIFLSAALLYKYVLVCETVVTNYLRNYI